jgi:hypothetical protein
MSERAPLAVQDMIRFVLCARLKTPFIRQGFVTLDALPMAVMGRGDVSDMLHCENGLFQAWCSGTSA